MSKISVNFNKTVGKIKPMHAVNNGPAGSIRGTGNFKEYQEAGFPYARNHDASFYSSYGGEHTVDVHRIFKNFDADENDPANYVFSPTDNYIKNTLGTGTKIFYRLGAAIEHGYKMGTYPPKDFSKWARICEHIIRHYNEGWADGFWLGIEYWEIWNEPDCTNPDGSNPCWQGTEDEFIELYSITASHLKKCFPDIKIGGPAFTQERKTGFAENFIKHIKENNIPLDFYSFHCYHTKPEGILETVLAYKKDLDDAGLSDVETILNEWNYVIWWTGDEWLESLKTFKSLKASSFIASVMCVCQDSPLDMLMYYDARPSAMNGIFSTDFVWIKEKGYYPFKMFNSLYKLGTEVKSDKDDDIYVCSAKNEDGGAILVTHFNDDRQTPEKEVTVDISGLSGTAKVYLLDNDNDMALVREENIGNEKSFVNLKMPLYSTYLITISQK